MKLESLWKILPRTTGMQKVALLRNLIVMPLLTIMFGLYGQVYTALIILMLMYVVWINSNLGAGMHRLQLGQSGFVARKLTVWPWYTAAAISGGLVTLAALASHDDAPVTSLNIIIGGSAFLSTFFTLMGIRLGWTSVISPSEAIPPVDPSTALQLVNPKGTVRQQLVYTLVGVVVAFFAIQSIAASWTQWTANANASAAAVAAAPNDAFVNAMAGDTVIPAATPQTVAPLAAAPQAQPQAVMQAPTPQAMQKAVQQDTAQQAVSTAKPTLNTYGNVVPSFFPGKSSTDAFGAAQDALQAANAKNYWAVDVMGVDNAGYPQYSMECEKDGSCVNGTGTGIGNIGDVAKDLWPVNPKDIGTYGIQCGPYLCKDGQDQIIGRNPSIVVQ